MEQKHLRSVVVNVVREKDEWGQSETALLMSKSSKRFIALLLDGEVTVIYSTVGKGGLLD